MPVSFTADNVRNATDLSDEKILRELYAVGAEAVNARADEIPGFIIDPEAETNTILVGSGRATTMLDWCTAETKRINDIKKSVKLWRQHGQVGVALLNQDELSLLAVEEALANLEKIINYGPASADIRYKA